jgi:hypothetical protein
LRCGRATTSQNSDQPGQRSGFVNGQVLDLFWTAATSLVQLHAEEKRTAKVRETLAQMKAFLAALPDRKRSAELARFRLGLARLAP